MKKTILRYTIIVALIVLPWAVFSQCDNCHEQEEISTNPADPKSCKWDEVANSDPQNPTTNPFLNSFNWAVKGTGNFDNILLNPNAGWNQSASAGQPYTIASYSMKSPFNYGYLWRGNGVSLDDHDWHWEDGWELLYLNTGYHPNGEDIITPPANSMFGSENLQHNNIPYFMLYNRYTGKLRTFASLYSQTGTFTSTHFKIGFNLGPNNTNASVNGMFRHVGGYDVPLDQKTENQWLGTNNTGYVGETDKWFVAENQLGYDPCICVNEQNFFHMWVGGVESYDVDLSGRSISVDLELKKDADGNPIYDDYFANHSVTQDPNSGGPGSFIYKSMDGLLDDYDENLAKYQQDIDDYNDPGSVAMRTLMSTAKTAFKYAAPLPVPESLMSDLVTNTVGVITGSDDKDAVKVQGKYYSKELAKATKGTLGTLSESLFTEFYTKPTKPVKPSMPMASFSEMTIKGEISKTADFFVSPLLVPGSLKYPSTLGGLNSIGHPLSVPVYDKPVGLFALLETPSISVYSNIENFSEENVVNMTFPVPITFISKEESSEASLKLKLNSPLKYRFNHSVDFDFEKTRLYVQVQVKYDPRIQEGNHFYENGGNLKVLSRLDNSAIITTDWYPIEEIGERLFGIELKNWEFHPNNPSEVEVLPMELKSISIKLMADMYFESSGYNGTEINSTEVFTYLLYDPDNGTDLITEKGQWLTNPSIISEYALGLLTLENEVIEPTDDFVFETVGTDIYVNAEEIELKGNITVQSGYKAIIQAYWGIESDPTTEIGQNIELAIKRDFYNFPETVEVDDTELSNYCSGTNKKYQANQAKAKRTLEPPKEEEQAIEYAFTVYPNPSSDMLNVESDIENSTVDLLNIDGKLISSFELKGYKASHNVSGISAGLYFVRLATPRGYKYLRFVKQ